MSKVLLINEALVECSYSKQVSMSELFRVLSVRLRDDRWICIFKTLSLIHLLTREGNSDRILGYLAGNPDLLQPNFHQQQGFYYQNQAFDQTQWIKSYSEYLAQKATCYKSLKFDWIRNKDEAVAKFRTMEDVQEILKQTEILQKQIEVAIECKWQVNGMSDIVLQQGFRLMIAEMIGLFHLGNEANVRILGLYFEMDRPDATKALGLYKKFTSLSKKMQETFEVAKQNRHSLNLTIPVFKLPPASLANTLEDYLNSPDFEQQKKKYKEKKTGKVQEPVRQTAVSTPANEKPLLDLFSEVENQMDQYNQSAPVDQNYTISSYWDPTEEFSKQAAMQQQLQDQMQQTNMLINNVPVQGNTNPFASFSPPPQFAVAPQQAQFAPQAFSPAPQQAASPPITQASMSAHNPFTNVPAFPASTNFQSTSTNFQSNAFTTPFPQSTKPVDTSFNVENVFGPGSPVQSVATPNMNQFGQSPFMATQNQNRFMSPQVTGSTNMTGNSIQNGYSSGNGNPFGGGLMGQQGNTFQGFNTLQGSSIQGNTLQGQGNPIQGMNMQSNALSGLNMQGNTMSGLNMQPNTLQGLNMQGSGLQGNTMQSMPTNTMQGNVNSFQMGNNSGFGAPSNSNPFTNQANQQTQQNPFIVGGMMGQTGSNQGSVLSNFHAPKSTILNNSLGSFSAAPSPNMQASPFPRQGVNTASPMMFQNQTMNSTPNTIQNQQKMNNQNHNPFNAFS